MKNVNDYMNLPYTIVVRKDDEGDYLATVEELDGCMAHGATKQEALENLEDVQRAWITECVENDLAIPAPRPIDGLPSGRWVQRVPKSLHRKLTRLAKQEGVSLNQLVTGILAEAVGERTAKVAKPGLPMPYYAPCAAVTEKDASAPVLTIRVAIQHGDNPLYPVPSGQVVASTRTGKDN
jgi:antitoxin HicB